MLIMAASFFGNSITLTLALLLPTDLEEKRTMLPHTTTIAAAAAKNNINKRRRRVCQPLSSLLYCCCCCCRCCCCNYASNIKNGFVSRRSTLRLVLMTIFVLSLCSLALVLVVNSPIFALCSTNNGAVCPASHFFASLASVFDPHMWDVTHLAVVVCGSRAEEALTMVKSAVALTSRPMHIHAFADEQAWTAINDTLHAWTSVVQWTSFRYSLYPITFPPGTDKQWRTLFKPCACQRLFIPDLLTDLDSLIYVDTDVLFMTPPEQLWDHFYKFREEHIVALAPESEDRATNWYVRFARHPFYQPLGVNSGVMLMNLTRMRSFNWGSYLWPLYKKYQYNITWGDQDIINIIFHDNPNRLFVYGCEWNFRPDHCMYTSTCKAAETGGARVVHGSRGYFHKSDKQPAFCTLYRLINGLQLGQQDVCLHVLPELHTQLRALPTATNCAKVVDIFLQSLRHFCGR